MNIKATLPVKKGVWLFFWKRQTFFLGVPENGDRIVYYEDDTLEVYQKDTMECLHTYTTDGWRISFLGKVNGYFVICDTMSGMLFDENGGLCARIISFSISLGFIGIIFSLHYYSIIVKENNYGFFWIYEL